MTDQPFNLEIHKSTIIDLIGEDVFNEFILDNNHPYDIMDKYIEGSLLFLRGRQELWDTILYTDENSQEEIFERVFFLWNDTLNDKEDEFQSYFNREVIDLNFIRNRPDIDISKVDSLDDLLRPLVNIKGGYMKSLFPFHDYDKTNEVYNEIIFSFEITPKGIDASKISELAHLRSFLVDQLKVQAKEINRLHKKIEDIIKVYTDQTLNTVHVMGNYHRKSSYTFFGKVDGKDVQKPYYENRILDSKDKRGSSKINFPGQEIKREMTIFVNYLLNKIYKYLPRDEKEWLDIKRLMLTNPFLPHHFKWNQFSGVLEYAVAKAPIQYATKRMIAQLIAIESILEDFYLDVDLKSLSQFNATDNKSNYKRTIGDTRLTFEQLRNYMPDIKELAKGRDFRNPDPEGTDVPLIIKSLEAGERYIMKEKIFEARKHRKVSNIVYEIIKEVPELKESQQSTVRNWVDEYYSKWHKNVLEREEE